MNWQVVLQTFSAGMGAIGIWFIYDLIREFKLFKKETRLDIQSLKTERQDFKSTVRNAELNIHGRVTDLQKIHNNHFIQSEKSINAVNMELERFKNLMTTASGKADAFENFLNKLLVIAKTLNDRLKKVESEMSTLKIEVGDLTIFKDKKKSD